MGVLGIHCLFLPTKERGKSMHKENREFLSPLRSERLLRVENGPV